jgi:tetratricopeptide (TPR) repeat protein
MYFHSISRICILIVLVGFSTFASAQSKKSQLRKGDHAFDHLAYSKAITHYLKFSKANPRHSAVLAKLGDSYRLVNDPKNAAKWYAEAVTSAPQVTRFHYASMLMQNEQFEEAAKQFEIYLKVQYGQSARSGKVQELCGLPEILCQRRPLQRKRCRKQYRAGADFCPVVSSDNKVLFSSNRQQQSFPVCLAQQ